MKLFFNFSSRGIEMQFNDKLTNDLTLHISGYLLQIIENMEAEGRVKEIGLGSESRIRENFES